MPWPRLPVHDAVYNWEFFKEAVGARFGVGKGWNEVGFDSVCSEYITIFSLPSMIWGGSVE